MQLGVEKAENNAHGYFFEAIVLPYSIGIEDRKHGVDNRCLVKQETRKKTRACYLHRYQHKIFVWGSHMFQYKRGYSRYKGIWWYNCKMHMLYFNSKHMSWWGVQYHPSIYFDKEQIISKKYNYKQSNEWHKQQCFASRKPLHSN